MFNKNKFEAMLLNHNVSKQQLADYLGIKKYTLLRRIKNSGNFTTDEIRQLINVFSREEVFGCLFDCQ